jgi:hypothetical protein
MSFKTDYEQRKAEAEQARSEAENSKTWLIFLTRHADEIISCEANYLMAQRMLNDANTPFTVENLELFLGDPSFRKGLGLTNADSEREKLVAEISGLLTGSPEAIAGEISKLKYLDNAALRAKVQAIRDKKEMQQKSPQELRQIIQAGRPVPEEIQNLPPEMTRKYLLSLSPQDLRATLRKFGQNAVNRRLANQS